MDQLIPIFDYVENNYAMGRRRGRELQQLRHLLPLEIFPLSLHPQPNRFLTIFLLASGNDSNFMTQLKLLMARHRQKTAEYVI
ncbi:hypothetical protein ANN_06428 [Periplaneta americana]|uniref:Uncharacterized protein n=1 Tax=Periplaneta americana TaxID=6978 RepID=A0ABQ8TFW5_PERAM|nr:hypothetical protein ANN_06428 [Periplaneta americana]